MSQSSTIPLFMYAWRKHRGDLEPVSKNRICNTYGNDLSFEKVWEEVPIPQTPARGFLLRMLASGGEYVLDLSG